MAGSCLFCLESCDPGQEAFCQCKAIGHVECLSKYMVGETRTRCPICRIPLLASLMVKAYDHAHAESTRRLGIDHQHTKLHRLNRASAMAIDGRHEEALQELEAMGADGNMDRTQRTVCRIESATVLAELGRPAEAIRRLRTVLTDLHENPNSMSDFFLTQSYLSLGHAYLELEQYSDAKLFFHSGLNACGNVTVCPRQLPISKLLQGLAICYEKGGRFTLALGAHRVRCKRVLANENDAVVLARAEIEWSQSELRCGKQTANTADRLATITRTLRRSQKARDPRATDLLERSLRCLDQMWPDYRSDAKRIRTKTHLEDLM